ncbi:ABC-type amino acid transport substrate-binding protein [Rhodopseudomonas julia]|uniref:ABC-type amino acid transport substrate-binding protein n=1 Tax=Rhodopseudomonas julia TaxID=200617 RepID=A0ABU0C8Q4_9BRAD|nr:transporter substrate-binding domain-containing protein [Rhodopseudomonas julia]MDQ0326890.1 ABC-type amino acid transport substrate-binding protein [Rhodopseudomonas julia]
MKFALVLVFMSFASSAFAQTSDGEPTALDQATGDLASPRAVDVGLYMSPPFVMEKDKRYEGMAIDLWETIAGRLNFKTDYQTYPTIAALLDATASGEIDVAVTNLSITEQRAHRIDFTYPWFDAGLRIMINEDAGAGFSEVVSGLRDSGYLRAYLWLAFVILAATVVTTIYYRRFDPEFPKTWPDSLAEGFYSVMSVATSGRAPIRKNLFGWVGRVWAALWLVCGVAVVAYLTSTVTSVMTAISINSQIDSLADLPGKTVGVFKGGVSEAFAQQAFLETRAYNDLDDAVAALLDGDVDAIIADAPVLEYYAHTHQDEPLDVVGPIFEPDKYGFGVSRNSGLTRDLTVEVIWAEESELVERLRTQYFGDDPS